MPTLSITPSRLLTQIRNALARAGICTICLVIAACSSTSRPQSSHQQPSTHHFADTVTQTSSPKATSTDPLASQNSSHQAAGSLDQINHIVVIMMENWSFDGLYGKF